MLSRLATGTTLRTYRIAEVIGGGQAAAGGQDTVAYLANDVSTHEELLLWQSPTAFKLAAKPRGVRDCFQQDGLHYLVLTLKGQNLSLLLTMAGNLDQGLAKLWMSQICQAIGYWHNRESLPPLSNQSFFLASRPVLCYNLDSAVRSSWRTRNARLRSDADRHSIGACWRHLVIYIG